METVFCEFELDVASVCGEAGSVASLRLPRPRSATPSRCVSGGRAQKPGLAFVLRFWRGGWGGWAGGGVGGGRGTRIDLSFAYPSLVS